ncbi:MAG: hypothetical protein IPP16_21520 [Acidimicrobiaceae bacterium]|nr:hypothetical protein [Acidimicrobiaceae bacterium]
MLASASLLVDESALTGESFPVEKQPGALDEGTRLAERTNSVWCGTHVVSGSGLALVTGIGADTEFGRVGERLAAAHVPTAFELGLRKFGIMLMRTAGVLVIALFIANVLLRRPIIESLLFSLALAVGLTPQLLPTIVSVTLSYGARQMAKRKVIVKRLDAGRGHRCNRRPFTDKTEPPRALYTWQGRRCRRHPVADVLRLAWINATSQHGFVNPLDDAIMASAPAEAPEVGVVAVLPYDFTRRMLSVLVTIDGATTLITKGALEAVLAVCRRDAAEAPSDGDLPAPLLRRPPGA